MEAVLRPQKILLKGRLLPNDRTEDLEPPAKIRRLEKFASCVEPPTAKIQSKTEEKSNTAERKK